jgi:hypothetical protein
LKIRKGWLKMKKTVLKCVVFSSSVFLLIHAVATLGYCKIINEDWSVALQVILLVAALPIYFFVKRNEEKFFAYPLLMAAFVACAFGISWIVFFVLGNENIIYGWEALMYLFTWMAIACYFGVVLAVDLIIAVLAKLKERFRA